MKRFILTAFIAMLLGFFICLFTLKSLFASEGLSNFDFQKGDVILVTNAWVSWFNLFDVGHTALYVGDIERFGVRFEDQTIEASPSSGVVSNFHVSVWDDPKFEVYVLRPNKNLVIDNVIQFAYNQLGKPYSFNYTNTRPYANNTKWYCTELVYSCFYSIGFQLFDLKQTTGFFVNRYEPIRPTRFLDSDKLDIVYYRPASDRVLPRVWNKSSGQNFTYLSDAVNTARSGDKIEILSDSLRDYQEIVVKASGLSLESSNGTTIYVSDYRKHLIKIESIGVSFSNLTLTGANDKISEDGGAALVFDYLANSGVVSDVTFINNTVGLALNESNNHLIKNNNFIHNEWGIAMLKSRGVDINNNYFINNSRQALVSSDDSSDCAALFVASEADKNELSLYSLRDSLGRRDLVSLYYKVSPYALIILESDPNLLSSATGFMDYFWGAITGERDILVTDKKVQEFLLWLNEVEALLVSKGKEESLDLFDELREEVKKASGYGFIEHLKKKDNYLRGVSISALENRSYFWMNNVIGSSKSSTADPNNFSWFSRGEITYFYRGQEFSGFVGNYWELNNYRIDRDRDGIDDEFFSLDEYPLVETLDNYSLTNDLSTNVLEWLLY